MSTYPPGAHKGWWSLRIVRVRWRLFFAALVALLVFALLPPDWRLINRILIGWDIGVLIYLMLAVGLAMVTDADHIRTRSPLYDEGRVAIPVLTATAALASIGAIFDQLTTAPAGHHLLNLVFAVMTILLSWSLIQVIFAFHYAHEYYAEHRGQVRGLGFPGDDAPNYWDFLYFAFVIGMTSQVSDVTVKSKVLRKMVMAHGPPLFRVQPHSPRACSKLSRKFNRQSAGLMNGDQALNVSTFVSSLDRGKHGPPLLLVPPRVGV